MNETLITIILFLLGLPIAWLILKYPYLGIAFTISSLPVLELLPGVSYLTSITPLIGGVTLLGYLLQTRTSKFVRSTKINGVFLFGLVFILWMYVSNPRAAWSGFDRNWVFTFVQLFILTFLSSKLLDTPEKQRTTMWLFCVISIFSAFYAIQSGYISETLSTSLRSSGFTDNPNAAARYFTVAMVFLSYLRSVETKPFWKALSFWGIIVTYMGVFFTVSRTGIILLFAAQILIFVFQRKGKERIQLLVVSLIALSLMMLFYSGIFGIIRSIIPAIEEGSDTLGLRFSLWEAAIRMFREKPLTGVGIGMYRFLVPYYSQDLPYINYRSLVVHNTYLQILAETGFVGFFFFMLMLLSALRNFFSVKLPPENEFSELRTTWLIAFLVMLIGGITKSDHIDKLTWMAMGCSVFFNELKMPVRENAAHFSKKTVPLQAPKIQKQA